jgi:ethanolamine permease
MSNSHLPIDPHSKSHGTIPLWIVVATGVAMGLGGHMFGWNYGLFAGFWPYFGLTIFIAFGYLNFAMCLAEMSSVLPFAGGIYGFVRVTLGPAFGFLVGLCEILQNIIVTSLLLLVATRLVINSGAPNDLQPLFWFVSFAFLASFHVYKLQWFWLIIVATSFSSIVLWLVFVLGSSSNLSFAEYHNQGVDTPGIHMIIRALPFPSWFFISISIASLVGKDVVDVSSLLNCCMETC